MIAKLLVANRGEIARRVMRTARQMGIGCVAIHSDADSGSAFVAEADEAVRLPGERASETYLNIEAVVEAALRTGADAVHPGYGFLSENHLFARACLDAGLTFVGPPPEVIEAMGSKLAAKATVAAAGVAILPTLEVGDGDADGLAERVADLRWPLLVKASAGGGGRGMRVVEDLASLPAALESARREALGAFGDATVFLEPYVSRPRHVEVQILGDTHGNIAHLFERDCSIQRRHQKIVEESPSPSVGPQLRDALASSALDAAKAIGYVNAGTVEFLLLEDRSFAFLEINTRLQVEHTVTESVTGLDLVSLQLLVAEGRPLPDEVFEARIDGHAIEARIYAEDPTAEWRPSAGHLYRFRVPSAQVDASGAASRSASIRVDSAVEDCADVSVHYDPLLAKVICHAPTREDASRALASVLERSQIHGLVTNRDLLVRVLRHPEFAEGRFDTGFLERHDPATLGAPLLTTDGNRRNALAAALAQAAARRESAQVLSKMPSGWRNVAGPPQRCRYRSGGVEVEVSYRFDRNGRLERSEVDGESLGEVSAVSSSPEAVVLDVDGVRRRFEVHSVDGLVFVDGPDGSSTFEHVDRFPLPGSQIAAGALVAPLPGTVVKVAVELGQHVSAGDTLVAIEAMKMEHEVRAGAEGTVAALHVALGQQVEAGSVLVVVEAADDAPAPAPGT